MKLVVVALLLSALLSALLATVALAQEKKESPEPGTSRVMTLDGPDCAAHAEDLALEDDPPQVTVSGLEKCLAPNSSDAFTVTASNLDTASAYTVTLAVSSRQSARFGFDAECATASLTYASAESATAVTQSPTLYSCGTRTAIGILHATLTQDGEEEGDGATEISRTSDYFVFVIPPQPTDGSGPRHPGSLSDPSAAVSSKPTTINRGQTSGPIIVTISDLETTHAGGMKLESSNNSVVGHGNFCSAGLGRIWSAGLEERRFGPFTLKACAYGSVTMKVTAYQEDPDQQNIHAHGTITDWRIRVPRPIPTPPPRPPLPPAPTSLRVVSTSDTSIGLDWDSRTGVSKYRVRYGSTTEETTSSTYHAQGLTCETSYTFTVDGYGNGSTFRAAWGADAVVSRITDRCPPPPDTPTNLRANGKLEAQKITLRWTDPSASTHHPATSYKVIFQAAPAVYAADPPLTSKDVPAGWTEVAAAHLTITGTTEKEASVGNFTADTTYKFRVQAANSAGKSGWSAVVWAYPTAARPTANFEVAYNTARRYLDDGIANYVICNPPDASGTALPLPAGKDDIITAQKLRDYVGVWDDAVQWRKADGNNIIQVPDVGTETACYHPNDVPLDEDGTPLPDEDAPYQIMVVDNETMDGICFYSLNGCWKSLPEETGALLRTTGGMIVLREAPLDGHPWDTTNAGGCSYLKLIAIHEAGHTFGLWHSWAQDSIMQAGEDIPERRACGPTPLDVAGVMAIYQSAPRTPAPYPW